MLLVATQAAGKKLVHMKQCGWAQLQWDDLLRASNKEGSKKELLNNEQGT